MLNSMSTETTEIMPTSAAIVAGPPGVSNPGWINLVHTTTFREREGKLAHEFSTTQTTGLAV